MKCLWWLWKCGDSSFIFIYCHFHRQFYLQIKLYGNIEIVIGLCGLDGWLQPSSTYVFIHIVNEDRVRAHPPLNNQPEWKSSNIRQKKKLAEIESKWTNKRSIEKCVICWKSTKQRINNKRISQWKKKKCMQSFDTNETIIDSVVQITCILKSHLHSRSAYSHAYHRLMEDWMGATKMYTLQTPFISIEQLTM